MQRRNAPRSRLRLGAFICPCVSLFLWKIILVLSFVDKFGKLDGVDDFVVSVYAHISRRDFVY